MKVYLILVINLFLFSLLVPIVGAFEVSEFDFSYPEARFDNNTAFVNSSSSWITPSLGILADVNATQFENNGNVLSIIQSFLTDLINLQGLTQFLSLSGGNANQNISLGIYSLDASWFKGKFNISSADDWIEFFDGNTIDFNESKLATIFFNATTIDLITGTAQGSITDLRSFNSIGYNVSEDASDFELRINFTGIIDFNNLIIRYRSEIDEEVHHTHIEIWNYESGEWEHHGEIPSEVNWVIPEFGVFDSQAHIGTGSNDGIVQVRIHQDGGVPPRTHKHEFDWVTISKGLGTPAPEEVDPRSIHKDGSTMWEGNENGNGFNSTGWNWISATFGNFINLTVQNIFVDKIFAKDWSNITIIESQVTDLTHTTDTWALNYTNYYNITQVDNNLSNYIKNNTRNGYTAILNNLTICDGVGSCSSIYRSGGLLILD